MERRLVVGVFDFLHASCSGPMREFEALSMAELSHFGTE